MTDQEEAEAEEQEAGFRAFRGGFGVREFGVGGFKGLGV